ncbi:MAG: toll/interleukin-1 receptor domain-containing protein [Aggregatilineales bacterium]
MIDRNRIQQALAELKSDDSAIRQSAITDLNAAIDDPELDDILRLQIMTEIAALGRATLQIEMDTAPSLDNFSLEDDLEGLDDDDSDALWLDNLASSKNPDYVEEGNEDELVEYDEDDHSDWLESLAQQQHITQSQRAVTPDKLSSMTDVMPSEFIHDIMHDMRAVNEIPEWLNAMMPAQEANSGDLLTEEFDVQSTDTLEMPEWLKVSKNEMDTLEIMSNDLKTDSDLQERARRSVMSPVPMTTDVIPVAAPLPSPSTDTTVQFSAYHPRNVNPHIWEPFYAYVFRASAENDVLTDAIRALGEKSSNTNANIPTGIAITATPYVPGFQFYPLSQTARFDEAWSRFDFQIKAKIAQQNQFETGHVTFTIDGIIVADVPIAIYVGADASRKKVEVQSTSSPLYTSIFCSYSHTDSHIIERIEHAYQTLGIDSLHDLTTLKSGNHWSEDLPGMIDRADVFQLFWSQSAAQSPTVRQEYEHALKVNGKRHNFIRPVCWENPLPPIPQKLSHLHFAYKPDLLKRGEGATT